MEIPHAYDIMVRGNVPAQPLFTDQNGRRVEPKRFSLNLHPEIYDKVRELAGQGRMGQWITRAVEAALKRCHRNER